LRRNQTAIITQFRTSHVPLNFYLARIKRSDSPMCPHCPETPEDVRHFFLECRNYAAPRQELQATLRRKANDIPYMLNNPRCIHSVLRYIHRTGRFTRTYGNLAPLDA
ncbi:hypothetical protein CPB86DRAFT_671779, partial [Serendipita vermifera]